MENPNSELDQETQRRINDEVSIRTKKERVFIYIVSAITIPFFLSAFFFNAEARTYNAEAQKNRQEASGILTKANTALESALRQKTTAKENLEEAKKAKAEAIAQLKETSDLLARSRALININAADAASCRKALTEAKALQEDALKMLKACEEVRTAECRASSIRLKKSFKPSARPDP